MIGRTLVLLTTLALSAKAQVQGVMLDEPVALPAFALSNELDQTFTDAELAGKWTLIMIGYATCPDVCPFTLGNLEHAISEVAMRVRPDSVPQVVFVSVDPDRDAQMIAEYAAFFHPDFIGMTGKRDQIDTLVEATDAFYRLMPPEEDGYYEVQHSAAVGVIGPDGMLRAKLQPPFDAGQTAEFLARLQIQYRKEQTQ